MAPSTFFFTTSHPIPLYLTTIFHFIPPHGMGWDKAPFLYIPYHLSHTLSHSLSHILHYTYLSYTISHNLSYTVSRIPLNHIPPTPLYPTHPTLSHYIPLYPTPISLHLISSQPIPLLTLNLTPSHHIQPLSQFILSFH